jgi:NADH-quinone oxidoreductase subunit M
MLAWTIYISFLGALALLLLPKSSTTAARILALLTAIAGCAIALTAFIQHRTGELITVSRHAWLPTLGIEYHLAADGISLCLILLTGIVAITGILFSWNINHRTKEFFAFYLLLIGAVYGVFLSYDLLLLFVFYEIVIIPKYFLIAIWGSTRREYGAMKLALYSFIGSAMVLIGLIAAYVAAGSKTMALDSLAGFAFPLHFQMWAFPLVFVGFAILAGLWPFHTWAPTGHVAAPTAASMLLAGVVMKLGAYGCLRVAMTLFPLGLTPWGFHVLGLGSWRDVFAVLAVIGIVYGALVALVQKDFKFVIGYSSVSHMGFILLGLMTLNQIGISGAVVQMVSHGILAGLLFAVVGRMVYDRTHTRELSLLGPMNLNKAIPFAAITFVLVGMASMGLPGFSGFVAELMILVGAWHAFPILALSAGVGIVLGVVYIWRAMQKAFFAETETASPPPPLPPITLPERLASIPRSS